MHFDADQPTLVWQSTKPRSREILYLDRSNIPLLSTHYEIWKQQLTSIEPEFVLFDLMHYLRTKMFDLDRCNREAVHTIVFQENAVMLPIELFIEKKAGVCRHFAMVSYYFFERMLIDKIIPIASIEIERKIVNIDGYLGRHAWVSVYLEENNRSFHFDPFWSIVVDSNNPDATDILKRAYDLQ